ncbi:hypothetical protein HID58_037750 [Brassica napus]|uniref:Uncharacterized protein n=1 Tax=Brassica napus TaxID=3708 RepID=A0ABQ8BM92_BRANA|nr:hypothetical protein HID58_037750 [Brassica napus]
MREAVSPCFYSFLSGLGLCLHDVCLLRQTCCDYQKTCNVCDVDWHCTNKYKDKFCVTFIKQRLSRRYLKSKVGVCRKCI